MSNEEFSFQKPEEKPEDLKAVRPTTIPGGPFKEHLSTAEEIYEVYKMLNYLANQLREDKEAQPSPSPSPFGGQDNNQKGCSCEEIRKIIQEEISKLPPGGNTGPSPSPSPAPRPDGQKSPIKYLPPITPYGVTDQNDPMEHQYKNYNWRPAPIIIPPTPSPPVTPVNPKIDYYPPGPNKPRPEPYRITPSNPVTPSTTPYSTPYSTPPVTPGPQPNDRNPFGQRPVYSGSTSESAPVQFSQEGR